MTTTTEQMCPIRLGEPCRLCHPGAHGPETCGLVYLVMTDPELRTALEVLRRKGPPGQPR